MGGELGNSGTQFPLVSAPTPIQPPVPGGLTPQRPTPGFPPPTHIGQPVGVGETLESGLPNQDVLSNLALESIFNPQPNQAFADFTSNTPSVNIGGVPGVNVQNLNPSDFGAGLGTNTATAQLPDNIISQGQSQQAIEGLLNPTSIFDVLNGGGGGIIDQINQRTNSLQEAFRTQQFANLGQAQDQIRAQFAADGVLSGSDVINEQARFAEGVLNDIAVFDQGLGLQSTQYLGDLAMQDLQRGSNNLQQILTQAMIQRGMNLDQATAEADRISREAIAQAQIQSQVGIANLDAQTRASIAAQQAAVQQSIAQAQIAGQQQLGGLNAQTQLALGQQGAGVDVLGLLMNDFNNQQSNLLGTSQLPLNLAGGLTGPLNISSQTSSSK